LSTFAGRLRRAYGRRGNPETAMNEDVLNTSVRKFLKQVGVTSQREIEQAVRDAVQGGKLKGNEKLTAKMVLTIDKLDLRHEVSEDIDLA
jgi:Family of unknown function (DUF6494)